MFDGVEELDIVGPWEVISVWSKNFDGPDTRIIVSQDGGMVTYAKGMSIMPTHSFTNCLKLDYLIVPGGLGTRKEVHNKALIAFIKET